jgi:succinoglycan biosynthesis transport protein ExoP
MTEPGVPGQEEIYEGLIGYLPSILLQRLWFVVIPLLGCALAGLTLAFVMPRQYRSSATVVVESKDLPSDIAASGSDDLIDQRIARIKQQVLSRPDLIELIQNNDLYAEQRRTKPLSKIIDMMRDATAITPVTADIDKGIRVRGSNTVAFEISFTYSDPAKAQVVAQQFTERLLRLDSTQLADQANATVAFLRDQAGGIQSQIAEIDTQIEAIKSRNGMALSRMGSYIPSTASYDVQISQLQRDNSDLMAKAGSQAANGDERVVAAEAQLAAAKAVYSDNHPDVITAQQKLVEARATAASTGANKTINPQIAGQIRENNKTIAQLTAQRSGENARASQAVSAQAGAPLLEEQIRQLADRADGFRRNYDKVAQSLLAAEASQKMENQQRGDRLVLVDPPTTPDQPFSPNRPVLIGGGIALGLMSGLGIALLIEFFMRPIRGAAALQNLLGVGPLVVIPTLKAKTRKPGKKQAKWRRNIRKVAKA